MGYGHPGRVTSLTREVADDDERRRDRRADDLRDLRQDLPLASGPTGARARGPRRGSPGRPRPRGRGPEARRAVRRRPVDRRAAGLADAAGRRLSPRYRSKNSISTGARTVMSTLWP